MFSTLQNVFSFKRSETSEERLKRLCREVRKSSAIGRDLLDKAEKNGCTFVFNEGMQPYGSYSPGANKILLNPAMPDERLMSTLVHEARHCDQTHRARETVLNSSMNLKTLIGLCRAREADAQTMQCAAAFEMRDKHPEVWEAYCEASPTVAKPFAEKMEKTNDHTAALSEAFKGWFDRADYVDIYDKKMLSFVEKCVDKGIWRIKEQASLPKALKTLCRTADGNAYMKGEDLNFLETPRGSTVKEDIFYRCEEASLRAYNKGLCDDEDRSYLSCYVKVGARVELGRNITDSEPEVSFYQPSKPALAPAETDVKAKKRPRKGALTLSSAFSKEPEPALNGRMERLIRAVSENSPTGAAVLAEAEKKGSRYVFSDDLGECLGTFDRRQNLIALNPKYSDSRLSPTLVHEARHAVQDVPERTTQTNIRSLLALNRAAEADATAFECAATYEMREALPETWREFKSAHGAVAGAYAARAGSGEGGRPALGEAFKAWYDDTSYVGLYDADVMEFLEKNAARAGRDFLSKNISCEAMAMRLCRTESGAYLSDASFVSSPRALSVGEDVARRCRAVSREAAFLYGAEDDSLKRVFVADKDGKTRAVQDSEQNKTSGAKEALAQGQKELNKALRETLPPWVRFSKNAGGR